MKPARKAFQLADEISAGDAQRATVKPVDKHLNRSAGYQNEKICNRLPIHCQGSGREAILLLSFQLLHQQLHLRFVPDKIKLFIFD